MAPEVTGVMEGDSPMSLRLPQRNLFGLHRQDLGVVKDFHGPGELGVIVFNGVKGMGC